ncbi:MAG: MerR family transcriptional regulator [Chloroflexota bacterium]|nr:MerR family transcriptional regulator [Chloroflexota bacterium]
MSDTQVAGDVAAATHQPWRGEPGDTGQPAGRLYMTSELRAATGLSRTHLDFYLREGIVQPTARTESGYLLFDEGELDTLRVVLRWRQDGLGIKQIRDRLGRPAS